MFLNFYFNWFFWESDADHIKKQAEVLFLPRTFIPSSWSDFHLRKSNFFHMPIHLHEKKVAIRMVGGRQTKESNDKVEKIHPHVNFCGKLLLWQSLMCCWEMLLVPEQLWKITENVKQLKRKGEKVMKLHEIYNLDSEVFQSLTLAWWQGFFTSDSSSWEWNVKIVSTLLGGKSVQSNQTQIATLSMLIFLLLLSQVPLMK